VVPAVQKLVSVCRMDGCAGIMFATTSLLLTNAYLNVSINIHVNTDNIFFVCLFVSLLLYKNLTASPGESPIADRYLGMRQT
jgi:hypothetical protein